MPYNFDENAFIRTKWSWGCTIMQVPARLPAPLSSSYVIRSFVIVSSKLYHPLWVWRARDTKGGRLV